MTKEGINSPCIEYWTSQTKTKDQKKWIAISYQLFRAVSFLILIFNNKMSIRLGVAFICVCIMYNFTQRLME